jgi:hypothetical protein
MVFFIASQFVISMHIMLKQQGKLRSLIFLSVLVMDALLFSQPETKVYQLTYDYLRLPLSLMLTNKWLHYIWNQ